MLQIDFCLGDHARNFLHALLQVLNAFFSRCEITRGEEVKAVCQALHVDQRIPLGLFQLFRPEDFVIDVLL